MNATDDAVEVLHCVNHPNRETYLRCGKCGDPICPKCTIPTPVGSRCRECAQLRRLPQYQVSVGLTASAIAAGVGVSALGWYILTFIPFFRFFAAVFVGIAIGDVMSRVAKGRSNVLLQGGAVLSVVIGWIAAEAVRSGASVSAIFGGSSRAGVYVALPLLLASYFAYTRLR